MRRAWMCAALALALAAPLAGPSLAAAEEKEEAAASAASDSASSNPLHTLDRGVDRTPQTGLVIDALTAGPYTYLWVQLGGEQPDERWVVTMRAGLEPGMVVRVTPIGRRRGFESARLHRRFDELWFAAVRAVEPD